MNNYTNSDYLQHFGVKGMKWGVRKKYKPKGVHKENNNDNSKEHSNKSFLTDRQKKYVKLGLIATGTALAIYGGYKLHKSGIINELSNKRNLMTNSSNSNVGGINIKLKNNNIPINKDIYNINPNYKPFDSDYNMNCGNCMCAFEMRRRGYDVEALGNPFGMRMSYIGQFFKGLNAKTFIPIDIDLSLSNSKPSTKRGEAIKNLIALNISKTYDGNASGGLLFPHKYGSHFINWVKNGDKIDFYDGQNPNIDLVNDLFANYEYKRNNIETRLTSIRLDDLDFKPEIFSMIKIKGTNSKRVSLDAYVDKGKNFVINNLTR